MNYWRVVICFCFCLSFGSGAWAEDYAQMPLRLSLKDALQSVDTTNLQVLMANARLEQAIARISEQESGLLPHLDGTVGGARQTSDMRAGGMVFPTVGPHIGPYNNFDARLRLTVALLDPSAFERFQAAKKGQALSQAQWEKTREDVLGLVADLFVDAKRKEETARLLKTLVDKYQMGYELSQENLAQGTGSDVDADKYKTQLDQTKYLYIQAQQQSHDADLDLEAALQISLKRPLVLIDDPAFFKTLRNEAAINFNNVDSADMALAQSQLEATKADERSAKADFLPKVSGTANYGRSGESPGNGSNTYFVGAQVSVPLWEGGSQQAQLREVKGQVKEAQENLADTLQAEQVNEAKARAAILESEQLMQAKAQKRITAEKLLKIAFHAQEIGTGTVFDLMQAKSDLAMAEDEYNEAQAAWVMAHIDLLHSKGLLRKLVKQGE